MVELRSLRGDTTIKTPAKFLNNNYRPVQARNGRTIYRSFEVTSVSGASKLGASLMTLVMFVVIRFV